MNLIKKQAAGAYITLAAIVVLLVGFILYGVTLSVGDGVQCANGGQVYLTKSEFGPVTTVGIIGLLLYVLGLVISNIKMEGTVGKVVEMLGTALRIVAPAIVILTAVKYIQLSLTGIGWTFFSNEELEINQVAIRAGKLNITSIIMFVVAALTGLVGIFFPVTKKD